MREIASPTRPQLESWEFARLCGLDWHSAANDAYDLARRKPILPQPDEINLSTLLAEELYEAGLKAAPILPCRAPLPAFEVTMFIDTEACDTRIAKLLQPAKPYREDMWIYGFDALFVADAPSDDPNVAVNGVTCLLTLHDCNDSSGGSSDVALFSFFEKNAPEFSIIPWNVAEEADWLCDLSGLKALAQWLAYLWRGIQDRLVNRPELVRQRHVRVTKEQIKQAKQQAPGRKRIVKAYRIITIEPETILAPPPTPAQNRTLLCPCWGVMGHWRQYRSGKRVWIHPYQKGKERDKHCLYSSKEYKFLKGDAANA